MIQRVPIPPRRSPRHYEDAEQQHIIAWANSRLMPASPDVEPGTVIGDYLYAVPNGGLRSKREAGRFVGLGVKAGVSDLVLALPRDGFCGFYLELKKRRHHFRSTKEADKSVSGPQRQWLDRMALAGYRACVAYGADEAIDLLSAYIKAPATLRSIERTL